MKSQRSVGNFPASTRSVKQTTKGPKSRTNANHSMGSGKNPSRANSGWGKSRKA